LNALGASTVSARRSPRPETVLTAPVCSSTPATGSSALPGSAMPTARFVAGPTQRNKPPRSMSALSAACASRGTALSST